MRLKTVFTHPTRSGAYALSCATGILYGLASPNTGLDILCWILLVPLLWAIQDKRPKSAFYLGWTAGFTIHLLCFYWIAGTVQKYSNLNMLLSILALVLFCVYSGLPFGIMACLATAIRSKTRVPPVLFIPACYISMEYLYPFIFPWHVGAGQYQMIPMIQIADIFGVYGVSALVVIVNCCLYEIGKSVIRRTPFPWGTSVCTAVLVSATGIYGLYRIGTVQSLLSHARPLKVGIVQPNVLIEERQSPLLMQDIARRYTHLTERAAQEGAELIVWPESAVSYVFRASGDPFSPSGTLRHFVDGLDVPLLFGSLAVEPDGYRNTAYLIGPQGATVGRYDKLRLLAFGEYMPFSDWIPQLKNLVHGVGDFKPGTTLDPLCWNHTCFGVLICYEAILKDLARRMTTLGAQFLVNITNDVWFGDTRCPEQHLMLAAFRSVENRVYLARAANTGISAFVDPIGRIGGRAGVFTQAVRVETLHLATIPSLYKKWGDWFPVACSILTVVFLIVLALSKDTHTTVHVSAL